ncbi:stage II sporulation protein R, partial [Acinetobacter sp. 163]|nr:stage II sporulation protein R [Acinetobacter sp. 163]
EISEKVLRFHVLANSDSEEDQRLKLKVRDAVGGYMQKQLAGVDDLQECRNIVDKNIRAVETVAARVVKEEGYDYKVNVDLEEISFPVKSYGDY